MASAAEPASRRAAAYSMGAPISGPLSLTAGAEPGSSLSSATASWLCCSSWVAAPVPGLTLGLMLLVTGGGGGGGAATTAATTATGAATAAVGVGRQCSTTEVLATVVAPTAPLSVMGVVLPAAERGQVKSTVTGNW